MNVALAIFLLAQGGTFSIYTGDPTGPIPESACIQIQITVPPHWSGEAVPPEVDCNYEEECAKLDPRSPCWRKGDMANTRNTTPTLDITDAATLLGMYLNVVENLGKTCDEAPDPTFPLGACPLDGDSNLDGSVDGIDFGIWRKNRFMACEEIE
jgi:hypothetical protein